MKHFLSGLCLALLLLTASALHGQEIIQGVSLDRLERYSDFINDQITEGKIPGAAILVARNGEIVFKNAYGYSNISTQRSMQPDDIFYIQSMTKPIITAAFMMLYEEGHFSLNDPVYQYIPAMKNLKVSTDPDAGAAGPATALDSDITIVQLLTHTAGFTHGLGPSKLDQEVIRELFMEPHATIEDRVNALLEFPLISQPGQAWNYSAAPDILSVLIEKFSGMSTDEFLKQRLFVPLGMTSTGYNVPAENTGRIVQNHGFTEDGSLSVAEQQAPHTGVTVWSGVNALYSTTEDYLKFCQMLLNGGSYNGTRFLSPKTIEIMAMNHSGDLFGTPGEGFGLGFAVVDDLAATNNLGSNGIYHWGGAFNTHFFIDPEEKVIAMFFTQVAPFDYRYHSKLRQMVFQAIAE